LVGFVGLPHGWLRLPFAVTRLHLRLHGYARFARFVYGYAVTVLPRAFPCVYVCPLRFYPFTFPFYGLRGYVYVWLLPFTPHGLRFCDFAVYTLRLRVRFSWFFTGYADAVGCWLIYVCLRFVAPRLRYRGLVTFLRFARTHCYHTRVRWLHTQYAILRTRYVGLPRYLHTVYRFGWFHTVPTYLRGYYGYRTAARLGSAFGCLLDYVGTFVTVGWLIRTFYTHVYTFTRTHTYCGSLVRVPVVVVTVVLRGSPVATRVAVTVAVAVYGCTFVYGYLRLVYTLRTAVLRSGFIWFPRLVAVTVYRVVALVLVCICHAFTRLRLFTPVHTHHTFTVTRTLDYGLYVAVRSFTVPHVHTWFALVCYTAVTTFYGYRLLHTRTTRFTVYPITFYVTHVLHVWLPRSVPRTLVTTPRITVRSRCGLVGYHCLHVCVTGYGSATFWIALILHAFVTRFAAVTHAHVYTAVLTAFATVYALRFTRFVGLLVYTGCWFPHVTCSFGWFTFTAFCTTHG